jgi:predicted DNA-binding ribbon-helix-helix protein
MQTCPCSFRVEPKFVESLDRIAKIAGVSRNQLIVNLLTVGMDELETFENLGIFRLTALMRCLSESVRARLGRESQEAA